MQATNTACCRQALQPHPIYLARHRKPQWFRATPLPPRTCSWVTWIMQAAWLSTSKFCFLQTEQQLSDCNTTAQQPLPRQLSATKPVLLIFNWNRMGTSACCGSHLGKHLAEWQIAAPTYCCYHILTMVYIYIFYYRLSWAKKKKNRERGEK